METPDIKHHTHFTFLCIRTYLRQTVDDRHSDETFLWCFRHLSLNLFHLANVFFGKSPLEIWTNLDKRITSNLHTEIMELLGDLTLYNVIEFTTKCMAVVIFFFSICHFFAQ